jgi:hypothetical protein
MRPQAYWELGDWARLVSSAQQPRSPMPPTTRQASGRGTFRSPRTLSYPELDRRRRLGSERRGSRSARGSTYDTWTEIGGRASQTAKRAAYGAGDDGRARCGHRQATPGTVLARCLPAQHEPLRRCCDRGFASGRELGRQAGMRVLGIVGTYPAARLRNASVVLTRLPELTENWTPGESSSPGRTWT